MESFTHLITDLAHWEFEVVASIIQDVFIFLVIRAWSRREHRFHRVAHKGGKHREVKVQWLQPSHVKVRDREPVLVENAQHRYQQPAQSMPTM